MKSQGALEILHFTVPKNEAKGDTMGKYLSLFEGNEEVSKY